MSKSLTYAELGEALKITPESANRLARRRRWARSKGNDGRTRVAVPDEALDRPVSPLVSPMDRPPDSPLDKLIKALEAHVETLKEQLVAAEARIERQAAEATARDAKHATEIAIEREKADRARDELAALADRLAAIAEANEANQRPWWRRLAG
jgi:hypothetical protein